MLLVQTTAAPSLWETSRLQLAHGTIWDANSGSIPRTRSRAITPYSPLSQEQSDYLGVVRSYLLITLQKTLSLKLVLMIRSVSSFQRNSSLAFQRRTSPGIYTLSESQPLWSHDRQKKLPNHLTRDGIELSTPRRVLSLSALTDLTTIPSELQCALYIYQTKR